MLKQLMREYKIIKHLQLGKILLLPFLGMMASMVTGCSPKEEKAPPIIIEELLAGDAGTRDNTPECLVPSAPGEKVLSNDVVTIDYSNASYGYIAVEYVGECEKVKLQITGQGDITYNYTLQEGLEFFPLSAGSNTYTIGIYENVVDNQYATSLNEDITVTLENAFGPFLFPNQYVIFDSSSLAVSTAKDLAYPANDDLEVIYNIYNYIIQNISYDKELAQNVQSAYTPVADTTLQTGKGICLDYASLMCAMLRSQRIPCRLEVGYAGSAYHAWISAYIQDVGWVNGIIQFDGKDWSLMDPTLSANAGSSDLASFIGDGSNYITKYIY